MSVYDSFINTATRLINIWGQLCWWQKSAPIDDETTTPGYATVGVVPDPIPCRIVWFSPRDLDRGVQEQLGMVEDSEVPEGMLIGLMAGGQTFTPENTDTVRRGAVDADPIAVMSIDKVAPNGTDVLYFVRVMP